MEIGIVAEGPADIAVLVNILKGKLGIERRDVLPLRPELSMDETDLASKAHRTFHHRRPEQFSNWSLVLEECRSRAKIGDFLDNQLAVDRLVIVHIDTAEAHEKGFDVTRPDPKAPDYCEVMRARVVEKLVRLLGSELAAKVRHAVAVEETEAWLLTIHDDGARDTGAFHDPKKRLAYVLEKQKPSKAAGRASARGPHSATKDKPRRKSGSEYDRGDALSQDFRDPRKLAACAKRNRSLKLFVDSL